MEEQEPDDVSSSSPAETYQQLEATTSNICRFCQAEVAHLKQSEHASSLRDPLIVLGDAMKSLLDAYGSLSLASSSLLLVQIQKLQALVTRMTKKHRLLFVIEKPAVLGKMKTALHAIGLVIMDRANEDLVSYLHAWKEQDGHLQSLIRQAFQERDQLIVEIDSDYHDVVGNQDIKNYVSLQSLLQQDQSDTSTKTLLRILKKKKKWHLVRSREREGTHSEASKREWWYLQQLLDVLNEITHADDSKHQEGASHLEGNRSSAEPQQSSKLPLQLQGTATQSNTNSPSSPAVPEWALCPISQTLLTEPVTLRADCAHTVSKEVFQSWIQQPDTTQARSCPVCGCHLKALFAKTNAKLKQQVEEWVQSSAGSPSTSTMQVPTPPVAGISSAQPNTINQPVSKSKQATRRFSMEYPQAVLQMEHRDTMDGSGNTVGTRLSLCDEEEDSLGGTNDVAASYAYILRQNDVTVPDYDVTARVLAEYNVDDQSTHSTDAATSEDKQIEKRLMEDGDDSKRDIFVDISDSFFNASALSFADFTPDDSQLSLKIFGNYSKDVSDSNTDSVDDEADEKSGHMNDASNQSCVRFCPSVEYHEPDSKQYEHDDDDRDARRKSNKKKKKAVTKIFHFIRNPIGKAFSSSSTQKAQVASTSTAAEPMGDGSHKTVCTEATSTEVSPTRNNQTQTQQQQQPPKSILKRGTSHESTASEKIIESQARPQEKIDHQLGPPLLLSMEQAA